MTIADYEERLKATEEKISKAEKLRDKYKDKLEKTAFEFSAAGYDVETVNPRELYDIDRELGDKHFDYRMMKDNYRSTLRKIDDLKKIRDNYINRIAVEKAKESDLSQVPQIVKDFVHTWRVKAFEFTMKLIDAYKQLKSKANDAYMKWYNLHYGRDGEALKYKTEYEEANNQLKDFAKEHLIVADLARYNDSESRLNAILDKEEKNKILDLINRVSAVVGDITDASNLRVGEKDGELNGIVEGTKGKCYVETIGAGGYNIQKFHYRVLVKPLRK